MRGIHEMEREAGASVGSLELRTAKPHAERQERLQPLKKTLSGETD